MLYYIIPCCTIPCSSAPLRYSAPTNSWSSSSPLPPCHTASGSGHCVMVMSPLPPTRAPCASGALAPSCVTRPPCEISIMPHHACMQHVHSGVGLTPRQHGYEGREIRTPSLLIWSQTRCRCAIPPWRAGSNPSHWTMRSCIVLYRAILYYTMLHDTMQLCALRCSAPTRSRSLSSPLPGEAVTVNHCK